METLGDSTSRVDQLIQKSESIASHEALRDFIKEAKVLLVDSSIPKGGRIALLDRVALTVNRLMGSEKSLLADDLLEFENLFKDRIAETGDSELSHILSAFFRLGIRPSSEFMESWFKAARELLDAGRFGSHNLTSILNSLGRMRANVSPEFLASWFHAIEGRLRKLKPGALSGVIFGLSELNIIAPEGFYSEWIQAVLEKDLADGQKEVKLAQFSTGALLLSLTEISKTNSPVPALFYQEWMRAMKPRLHTLGKDALWKTVFFIARSNPPVQSDFLETWVSATEAKVDAFGHHDLTNSLWALFTLGFVPPDHFINEANRVFLARLENKSGLEVAKEASLYVFSVLVLKPSMSLYLTNILRSSLEFKSKLSEVSLTQLHFVLSYWKNVLGVPIQQFDLPPAITGLPTPSRIQEYNQRKLEEALPDIEWRSEAFIPEIGRTVDLLAPKIKLVVETDGYRHYNYIDGAKVQRLVDLRRDEVLRKLGYFILRIPVGTADSAPAKFVARVTNEVRNLRGQL